LERAELHCRARRERNVPHNGAARPCVQHAVKVAVKCSGSPSRRRMEQPLCRFVVPARSACAAATAAGASHTMANSDRPLPGVGSTVWPHAPMAAQSKSPGLHSVWSR
jgi:hypothetical protein